MQLHRGVPPLVVLCGDQPLIQSQVLGARRFQRFGERVEPVGNARELLRLRVRQPHLVVPALEVGEALREAGERTEHASEQKVQDDDDRDVEHHAGGAERDRVPQTSAISSLGSPMISTEPIGCPFTTTGTVRLASGGAISAANQAGARSSRTPSEPPTGRRTKAARRPRP